MSSRERAAWGLLESSLGFEPCVADRRATPRRRLQPRRLGLARLGQGGVLGVGHEPHELHEARRVRGAERGMHLVRARVNGEW